MKNGCIITEDKKKKKGLKRFQIFFSKLFENGQTYNLAIFNFCLDNIVSFFNCDLSQYKFFVNKSLSFYQKKKSIETTSVKCILKVAKIEKIKVVINK